MKTVQDLPPFNPDSRCQACGWNVARVEFRGAGRCNHYNDTQEFLAEVLNPRLHRECERCGFMWDEAVLPQPTSGPVDWSRLGVSGKSLLKDHKGLDSD